MSYSKDSSKRNYRGRGKRAARHQNPKFEEHASDTGLMRPISADAVAQAGGRVVASQADVDSLAMDIPENDPFAPKTNTAQFAQSLAALEATTVVGGIGSSVFATAQPTGAVPRRRKPDADDEAAAAASGEVEPIPNDAGGDAAADEPQVVDVKYSDASADESAEADTARADDAQAERGSGYSAEALAVDAGETAEAGAEAEAEAAVDEDAASKLFVESSLIPRVEDAPAEPASVLEPEAAPEPEVAPVPEPEPEPAPAQAEADLDSEVDSIFNTIAKPASEFAAAGDAPAADDQPAAKPSEPVVENPDAQARSEGLAERLAALGSEGGAQAGAAVAGAAAADALEQSSAQYSRESERYSHRKGFSRGQRTALIVIAVIAVVLCIAAGAGFAMWQGAQKNIELEDQTIKENLVPVVTHGDPYWVLVLGSDTRSTDTADSRSDVIMLARIDEVQKKVTLVSIPRDTKVVLDGYGTQKINAAFALGGAKLAIDTISDYAGVDITHYVEVYFKGFRNLVDQIGGVDVDVPEYASYGGVTIEPGPQHLNGKQALTLARNRKTYATGDFRRTECQRLLVQAIAQKVLAQDVTQLPGTIDALTQCFSTDMPLADIMGLATSLQGITGDSFYSAMSPSTTGMVDGVSYTFTYINQWKLIMQRAIKGENPKLDDDEVLICGTASTQTEDLDMTEGLPPEIQQQIEEYQEAKKKKEAEKEAKAQKKAAKKAAEAASTSS